MKKEAFETESADLTDDASGEVASEDLDWELLINPYAPGGDTPVDEEALVGDEVEWETIRVNDSGEFVDKFTDAVIRHVPHFSITMPMVVTEQEVYSYNVEVYFNAEDSWEQTDELYTSVWLAGAEPDSFTLGIFGNNFWEEGTSFDSQYTIFVFPEPIPEGVTATINGIPAEFNEDRTKMRVHTNYHFESRVEFQEKITYTFEPMELVNNYESRKEEFKHFGQEVVEKLGVAHTGNPVGGDYIRYQYRCVNYSNEISEEPVIDDGNLKIYECTAFYSPSYYTTIEQENEVTAKVQEVLAELDIADATDYEKVLAIHDYISTHTRYGDPDPETEFSKMQYTAYAALIKGQSVCAGYASLFYRMCLEVGVDARYISGTGGGELHGWNIVKIGDLYYCVDCTWDYGPSTASHRYFLKESEEFGLDHFPDEEFMISPFIEEYPLSAEDYVYEEPQPDPEPEFGNVSLTLSGKIGLNVYMKVPTYVGIDEESSYMVFTVCGKESTDSYDMYSYNSNGDHGYTCYVNAAQLADEITAVYHYTKDGEEFSVTNTYTIQEVIEYYVNNMTDKPKVVALAKALADFGYHTQAYLAESNEWTLGAAESNPDHVKMSCVYTEEYSPEDIEDILAGINQNEPVVNLAGEDIGKVSFSLLLDSETTLCLYFTMSDKDYNGVLTANVYGKDVVPKKVAKGKYKLVKKNVLAQFLGAKYEFKVTTDAGTSSFELAGTDYARICLRKKNASENEKNAMAAICRYREAANAYVFG